MSMRPNALRHASIMARTCASSVTSQTWVAISPSLPTRATVSAIDSAFLSTANTLAPSRANSTAAARPLPQPGPTQPAPAISATLPATRPAMIRLAPLSARQRQRRSGARPHRRDDLLADPLHVVDGRDDLAQHELDADLSEPPQLAQHALGRADAAESCRRQHALLDL